MQKHLAASATLALLSVAGAAQAALCLDPNAPEGFTRQTIQLKQWVALAAGPHFYYRLLDHCCVVLVSADRVTSLLASSTNEQYHKLLTLIQKDVPLARVTDLFSYVLSAPVGVLVVQGVVADLLERGEATLFDVSYKKPLPKIELRRGNEELSRFRNFCYPGGVMLLESRDCSGVIDRWGGSRWTGRYVTAAAGNLQ